MEPRLKAIPIRVHTALVAAVCVILGSGVAQAGGKQAWTHAATSAGLHNTGQVRTVNYAPRPDLVPPGAVITQVSADRQYAGNDAVQTSLCWNGQARCIDLTGRHINTQAFNGLDASRPMSLVHRLEARNGSPTPLYIKGNVTVWFSLPATRSEP